MKITALEYQLFSWKEFESPELGEFFFYQVTLNIQIGGFPPGTKFETAVLDTGSSKLFLYNGQEPRHVFDLKISAGQKIS